MEKIVWHSINSQLNNGLYPELKRILDNHQASYYANQIRSFSDALKEELLPQRLSWENLNSIMKKRLSPHKNNYLKLEKELVKSIKNSHLKDVMKQPAMCIKHYYNVSAFF
jgi:hypothetical protein